jgi:formylglycine-generating enzyme required for sulfatase activity
MGKYEVTQAEWQAVMGSNPSTYVGPNLPVDSVGWNDGIAYCAALTAREQAAGRIPSGYQYRLPTEAEWEYCCRAGTTTEWNVGTSLSCGQANFRGVLGGGFCGHPEQTTCVGSYAPNAWGLHDMHGNLWEWCLDAWDGAANYPSGAVADPYVSSGPNRVTRGGSYHDNSDWCRSALRVGCICVGYNHGFRVVLAPVLVP